MKRVGHDFSWHLLALVIVVAGLGLLAPLAWWHAQDAHFVATKPPLRNEPILEPQLAPIHPLVAEQINLDPSVPETPALPTVTSPRVDQELMAEPRGELRLSATAIKTPDRRDLTDIAPLRQPPEPPITSPPGSLADAPSESKAWPNPAGLIEQLDGVTAAVPTVAQWTARAKEELRRLAALPTLSDPAVAESLRVLRILADQAKVIAQPLDDQGRSKVLRAGYAIVRRLVIWDQVHTLSTRPEINIAPIVDRQAWNAALAAIDELLQATGRAAEWRKYLLIDAAQEQIDASSSPVDQRRLARDMLHRIHSTQLSHDQTEFLKMPPFLALAKQLRERAAETPNLVGTLAAIEHYESEDRSTNAKSLTDELDALRWSPLEDVRELASTINAYYRNANVRVALSAKLVNRMIPPQNQQVEAVEDVIVGAFVSGQSQTDTKLRLVLIPDSHRWHIGLEAQGQVSTNTSSSKGPATFFQNGLSVFRARKRLTVDRRGIRLFSAEAEADANNNLDDFETDFDGIPLLGGIVRAVARNQYEELQPVAKAEVEGKIVVRATSQLDREVAAKLEQGKRDMQAKLIDPLQQLSLEPTTVDMETTAERLIGRYRIASREQVSAHTPRPQAPGDSILSVQIHESALNNVLDKLRLAGRRIELHELYKEMNSRFLREEITVPEDMPEDVYVTFADEDPVRVDCQDGRVRLTIRLKELAQGTKSRWADFTVRGYYAPSADQLDANLEREGIIELIGDNHTIPIGQQIALRGIFARVLSRNRKLHVINKQIAEAKELRDQQVTQFVIHDGWIGVALGPKAPGRQAAMQPRPELGRQVD
jgi:hypothetical protein